MKVVILAGGFGTRISEESYLKPKPMIDIGDRPILWHIMKIYDHFGFNEFVICAGYKQFIIKQWFQNYWLNCSNITFDYRGEHLTTVHESNAEQWKVTVVDTGLNTMTGGRVRRIQNYIGEEPFFLTYGDGVANVNIKELLRFHEEQKKIVTLTGIQPEGRFGVLDIEGTDVHSFREKSKSDVGWINAGFMVVQPEIFEYLDGDETILERSPLERLANEGQVACYKFDGFWSCMDTLKDKERLDGLWNKDQAPWKVWK